MKIVGLTGGIGSGKSTVLKMFQALGAVVYIADIEAKRLLNTNETLIQKVIELFGAEAYVNNELNRSFIASKVFNDSEKLNALNSVVHPAVRKDFQSFVKNSQAEIVIYEAAILFESGSYKLCHYIVTVTVSIEERIRRTMLRDNISKKQVLERVKHQVDEDFRINNSHIVIRNNELKNTKTQVFTAFELLLCLV